MQVGFVPAGLSAPAFPPSSRNPFGVYPTQATGNSQSLYNFAQKPSMTNRIAGNKISETGLISYDVFSQQASKVEKEKQELQSHRGWPWRAFAFASDLGIVGYLLNKPGFGWVGALISLPYYAYGIFRQPSKAARKEEALYQSTANGLFPILEAKLGMELGNRLSQLVKNSGGVWPKVSQPVYKAVGSLIALLTLTPTVGDRLSHKIVKSYQEKTT